MSLASSVRGTGGARAGNLPVMMAPRTNAVTRATPRIVVDEGSHGIPGGPSVAPPLNLNAIAADLLDKNQQLSIKNIKNYSSYPIVAMDLYGDDGIEVAYYPPRMDDDAKVSVVTASDSVDEKLAFKSLPKVLPSFSGKNGNAVIFRREHDSTYKALRKMIKNGMCDSTIPSNMVDSSVIGDTTMDPFVIVHKPQLALGVWNIECMHPAIKANFAKKGVVEQESTPAIAEESHPDSHVSLVNGSLDGSASSSNNSFDRVLFQLKLKSDRKALNFLPEELVSIIIAKCKKHAFDAWEEKNLEKIGKDKVRANKTDNNDEDGEDDDYEERHMSCPPAIAVPAWATYDAHMEALQEACDKNPGAVFYQRSVAALVGALVSRRVSKKSAKGNVTEDTEMPKLTDKLSKKWALNKKQRDGRPIVIMCGLTDIGIELTAIQLNHVNSQGGVESTSIDAQCPFRDIKVLCTVAMCHSDPASSVKDALTKLIVNLDCTYPELLKIESCIDAIVTYGTIAKQLLLKESLLSALKSVDVDERKSKMWNDQLDFFSCREEAVVIGTAILGAVSHERIVLAPVVLDTPGSGKRGHTTKDTIVKPAIEVHNVSTTRVSLSVKIGDKISSPKMLFDFDQRVPSTSVRIEFSAAECVALKKDISLWDDPEKLHEQSQKWTSKKFLDLRNEAAKEIEFFISQAIDQTMHTVTVGNSSYPLRADKDGEIVMVESSYVEFKANAMGMLTQSMTSSSKMIAATNSDEKRKSFLSYVIWTIVVSVILGFLVKSYVDEKVFDRDVAKLLAYYKHVIPGSISDGDEYNARYLVWKYKNKKDKLWKKLEEKYGIPVREASDWDKSEHNAEGETRKNDMEEEHDLDEDTSKKQQQEDL